MSPRAVLRNYQEAGRLWQFRPAGASLKMDVYGTAEADALPRTYTPHMIGLILPFHLRTLAGIFELRSQDGRGRPSPHGYPMLHGAICDHDTSSILGLGEYLR